MVTPRTQIATQIYCAQLQKQLVPDVVMCLEKADEILREAKETQGFFVDVAKYDKCVALLKKFKDEDFRGNRPSHSVESFNLLNELGEL